MLPAPHRGVRARGGETSNVQRGSRLLRDSYSRGKRGYSGSKDDARLNYAKSQLWNLQPARGDMPTSRCTLYETGKSIEPILQCNLERTDF